MRPVTDRARGKGPAEGASLRDPQPTLDECFREISFLTLLLRQQEGLEEVQAEQQKWLSDVALALLLLPRWWGLMPRSWRRRRMRTLFQESGLFDGDEYLRRNPDVAATGADPLRHYLQHGLREGRHRSER